MTGLAGDFRRALLSWYDQEKRRLPWRGHFDPYAVLVSEIMLQQTTVQAVIPYFERWMKRYPSVKDLAAAGEEEVLRSWEGLGYYSRARNLHQAAKQTMTRYGGKLPSDPEGLATLPGIGKYTAGAVASMGFGKRVPALDANVFRVLSRLLAVSITAGGRELNRRGAVERHLMKAAGKLIPPDRPGDFNQALMDLGASVCRPSGPACGLCPLEKWCRARRLGLIDVIPDKPRPVTVETFETVVGVVFRNGRILVQRRPSEGLFGGMWEFPGVELASGDNPGEKLGRHMRQKFGLEVEPKEKLGVFPQAYTRFKGKLHVFICSARNGRLTLKDGKWAGVGEIKDLPLSRAHRRIFEALLKHGFFDQQ